MARKGVRALQIKVIYSMLQIIQLLKTNSQERSEDEISETQSGAVVAHENISRNCMEAVNAESDSWCDELEEVRSDGNSCLNEEQAETALQMNDILSDVMWEFDQSDGVERPNYDLFVAERSMGRNDDSVQDIDYAPVAEQRSGEGESEIRPSIDNANNIVTSAQHSQSIVPYSDSETDNDNVDIRQNIDHRSVSLYVKNKIKYIKEKRNQGFEYKNYRGRIIPARKVKPLDECRKGCATKITLDDQKKIFTEYWNLGSYDKRVLYISSLMTRVPKKTTRIRTTGQIQKPRINNYLYFIKRAGILIEVCKKCFKKTYGETDKFLRKVNSKSVPALSGITSIDKRGLSTPVNKVSESRIQLIKDHINSYPAYESHYTRRHTEKKYLAADLNLTIMHNMYKNKTTQPVSVTFFKSVFKTMGLKFKKPSLDTCNTCDTFKMKIKLAEPNELANRQQIYNAHVSDADKSYDSKKSDIGSATDIKRVYCFDLQQCLPTPSLKTNIVFYKRLLWTFNLTIYDCVTKKSYCYMWHETEGGRGANQIASCLYDFLITLPPHIKEVTFYSDTCSGQNKNSHVAAMFLSVIQSRPDLIINQKFLTPGHTHMEVDTVHALIEQKKKKTFMNIHVPRDWYNFVRQAHNNITVHVMSHYMFFDFAALYKGPLQLRKTDCNGDKFIWHDAKWFCYSSGFEKGEIKFKNTLEEGSEFKSLNFCRRGRTDDKLSPKQLYNNLVPISKEKKKDLLSILHLIDKECHLFYKMLPDSSNVPNVDPDIEGFVE